MKQLTITANILFLTLLLTACAPDTEVTPSQNSALNSISNSNAHSKNGAMQQSLNSWLKNEWEPTVKEDKKIQKKYMKKEKTFVEKEDSFTLQEYVDKAAVYMKAHPNDYNSSNVHKLESLPAIGK